MVYRFILPAVIAVGILLPSQSVPEIPTELPHPKAIDDLPLLGAIVMETLRLHSPIPGIQPQITPAPFTTLAGYDKIPRKTRVNAQAYSLHRNHDVSPNPGSFLPDRWLKPMDSVELGNMRRWLWAFGSGGRMCVRSNLALQARITLFLPQSEIKLVVAAIYSNFTSKIIDDDGIEPIDAYTVRPSNNRLVLKFERV
ncbi:cytochrome P450 monooxygenase [Histoplasma capsulatum H143]|uniref:Cytochrome P450 monooxygenase n=1 Tax=Ajellomyces capsulatus (strain H143) TaxID=544712 RepID=C6HE83_AJECH|nr:cytochrome P450 monooxygenase [Histoplasma capsulatum H143]